MTAKVFDLLVQVNLRLTDEADISPETIEDCIEDACREAGTPLLFDAVLDELNRRYHLEPDSQVESAHRLARNS
jgi:hypothetical protein